MQTFTRLLGFLRPHRRGVIVSFLFAAAAMAAGVAIPWLTGQAIGAITHHDRSKLVWFAVAVGAAGALRLGLSVGRRLVAGRVSLAVEYDLRARLYSHLQSLELGFFDRQQTGQLMSRVTVDLQAVRFFLGYGLIFIGQSFFTLALAAVAMFIIQPVLALIALAPVPFVVLVAFRYGRRSRPAMQEVQQRIAELTAVAQENVSGVRVVKAFAREQLQLARFRHQTRRVFDQSMYTTRLQARYAPMIGFLPYLGLAAILLVGGRAAIDGSIDIAVFTAFYGYVLMLTGPMRTLGYMLGAAQRATASGARIFQVLDRAPGIVAPAGAPPLPDGRGRIELRDVSLTYEGASRPALEDVDLTVMAGSTVALVGGTGSGKTSLVSLLPRLYDVTGGAVLIDGVDVRTVDPASLRREIAVVTDDPFLFSATVHDNIAYARGGQGAVSRAEVEEAARRAHADGFVRELPDGYDTMIGERGLTLSGGQRQRIAIARALLANPRILVLDDATSSVDASTEQEIKLALGEVMEGRTTFVIAHRLSTIALADEIVVLERGRIVAHGTHDELLAQEGLYREIVEKGLPDQVFLTRKPIEEDVDPATNGRGPRPAVAAAAPTPAAAETGFARRSSQATTFGRRHGDEGVSALASGALGSLTTAGREQDRLAELRRRLRQTSGRGRKVRGLIELLRPYRGRVALMFGTLIVATGATLAPIPLATQAIDKGIQQHDVAALDVIVLVFLAAALVSWGASAAQTYLTGWVGQRALQDLRVQLFRHLQSLSLSFYSRVRSGVVISRITNDVEALDSLVSDGIVTLFQSTLTLLGVVVILVAMDAQLALYTFLAIPLLAAAALAFRIASADAFRRTRERIAAITGYLQETLSGIRVVRSFGQEQRHVSRFADLNTANRDANMTTVYLNAAYFPGVELLSSLVTVGILVIGGFEVIGGHTQTGIVFGFIAALNQFFDPIQQLSQLYTTYQSGMAALDKIFELLDEEPELVDRPGAVELEALRGELSFEHVSFRYGDDDAGPWALRDVDLHVAPGQTVALVGETGAGKSTLAKLVARFYDPTTGVVRVDGHDLRDVAAGSLRARMGIVPQEGFLFSGTIGENIAFGRPDATPEEIAAAAAAVGADVFVDELPLAYDTEVGERGVQLSAGQRQLIAFARALIADPRILVLDEATSNVDIQTETRIELGLRRLLAGRTAIVIAHRLSTIRHAGLIVVLDGGRIVEQGTHDELIAAEGAYWALYQDWAEQAVA
ncbi:MAG TPA: ABC transporter ATP-binding protein [Conexibacter sp.]|jgi:ATP-binding cassette subfamily B protein|nr:ABC transporter ATP-binding protein [Conexibacter sp.]